MEIPDELLEKYAPKYMAWLRKYLGNDPFIYTRRDGKNYSMPIIWTLGPTQRVLGIRQDWLDKVGITKKPETLDEIESALQKFRNDDPDGNGKKDTYGLTARADSLDQIFTSMTKSSLRQVRKDAEAVAKGQYDVLAAVDMPEYFEVKDRLDQLTLKNYVDFIIGKRPISQFDQFVDEWNKAGGAKTMEVAAKEYDKLKKK